MSGITLNSIEDEAISRNIAAFMDGMGNSTTTAFLHSPPARNKHCSCGSGLKYKKCCGVVPNRTVSNMERIRSALANTGFTKRSVREAAENMSDEQMAELMEVYGELV